MDNGIRVLPLFYGLGSLVDLDITAAPAASGQM